MLEQLFGIRLFASRDMRVHESNNETSPISLLERMERKKKSIFCILHIIVNLKHDTKNENPQRTERTRANREQREKKKKGEHKVITNWTRRGHRLHRRD